MEKKEFEKPELKELDMDEIVDKILDLNIVEGNKVNFTEEAKSLIHTAAEKARKTKIYEHNFENRPEKWKEAKPEDLFMEMLLKIINAPAKIHMIAVPRLMLPAIDDAIRRQQA